MPASPAQLLAAGVGAGVIAGAGAAWLCGLAGSRAAPAASATPGEGQAPKKTFGEGRGRRGGWGPVKAGAAAGDGAGAEESEDPELKLAREELQEFCAAEGAEGARAVGGEAGRGSQESSRRCQSDAPPPPTSVVQSDRGKRVPADERIPSALD